MTNATAVAVVIEYILTLDSFLVYNKNTIAYKYIKTGSCIEKYMINMFK